MKRTASTCAGLSLVLAAAAGAAPTEEEYRALQQRVDRLERQVQGLVAGGSAPPAVATGTAPPGAPYPVGEAAAGAAPIAPVPGPAAAAAGPRTQPPALPGAGPAIPVAAPLVAAGTVPAGAMPPEPRAQAQYFLSAEPLDLPVAGTPAASGAVPFAGTLSFHPRDYGVAPSGRFLRFDDPSRYRSAAVHLEGVFEVPEAGAYQLVLQPKPSREGGSTVATRLSARVRVDGTPVAELRDSPSRQSLRQPLQLYPGPHQLELWAVAVSPGFGPSPVDSVLQVALQGPRDAIPRPLGLHWHR